MTSRRPHKYSTTEIRTVRGINPVLWRWVRARVTMEHRPTGEYFNELIEDYKASVEKCDVLLELVSPHRPDYRSNRTLRGVDPQLWRWLRARSILEACYLGSMLNELIYRHMVSAGEPRRAVGSFLITCVICGEPYETEYRDAESCSRTRCRVALHRRRRAEEERP